MREPWIRNCGTADAAGAAEMMTAWQNAHPGCKTLFFCTDRFVCDPETAGKDAGHLLEARLFTENAELWLHRGSVGAPFAWREADDTALAENVKDRTPSFLSDPAHYRTESVQKLDIDVTARPAEPAGAGFRSLMTTGGRGYTLPVDGENAVRLVVYMDYDENGVCRQKDFRCAGFVSEPRFGKVGETDA